LSILEHCDYIYTPNLVHIFDFNSKKTISIQVGEHADVHLHKKKLLVISQDCSISVYDALTGEKLPTINPGFPYLSLYSCSAVSNNKIAIASNSKEASVKLIHLKTGETLHTFQVGQPGETVTALAFDNSDPEHSFLAAGTSSGTVAIFPSILPERIEDIAPPSSAHWTCLDCLFDCCRAIGNFFKMIWSSL
jgi:WD40 repeat protein